MKEFRPLAEGERDRDRLIEMALGTDETKQLMEKYDEYSVALFWGYLTWRLKDGDYQAGGSQLIYDEGFNENPFPENDRDGELYYFVSLYFGEPSKEMVIVAINPDNKEVVNVQDMDLKPHK
ncbi:MAG TPA: hypothetical protein G4O15_06805 [Dehalococcoidia bacterium]|nr:hypothetical protein [Dehalococcoidia bacterium]